MIVCQIMPDNDNEAVVNGPRGCISYVVNRDGKISGAVQKCPGCDNVSFLEFRPCGDRHPSWEWNGDRQKPTLTPSVYHKYGCGSHTYLRNGIWVQA